MEKKPKTKYEKDVTVENDGISNEISTKEVYSSEFEDKKNKEDVFLSADTNEKYYNDASNGVTKEIKGSIKKDKKSFWGGIKSRIVDTFHHKDIDPSLISQSNGYDKQHSWGISELKVEKKGGKEKTSVSYSYGSNAKDNQLRALSERNRSDGTIKNAREIFITPSRLKVYEADFKDDKPTRETQVFENSVSEAKYGLNGKGSGKSAKIVDGEIFGSKEQFEGDKLTVKKPMSPRMAERFFNSMQEKGDKIAKSIMNEMPIVESIADKATNLDFRESDLDKKRAKLNKFKEAKSFSELNSEVRDAADNVEVMPLGKIFEKNYDIKKISEEAKAKARQNQY